MIQFSNIQNILSQYPYNTPSTKSITQYYELLKLRLMIETSFPEMNLIPKVCHVKGLKTEADFLEKYHTPPPKGFQEMWDSKSRNTKKQIESFYKEHDLDIFRQAYLSRFSFQYKFKLLRSWHVIETLLEDKDLPLLDYGCGAGALVNFLTNRGYSQVDACDIPSQTLDFVKKSMAHKLRKIFTVTGKEEYLKDEYALIISLDVLEHTTDPDKIVARLLKTLRPGGYLVVKFPIEDDFSCSHLNVAQKKRPATFKFLRQKCVEIETEYLFQKK